MKKLFCVVAVAFAIVPPLLAQDNEAPSGFIANLSAIGRFDANPYSAKVPDEKPESGFSFSNTSVYTLVDLQFTNWLSFSMENHWIAVGEGYPGDLYRMTGRSDYGNWLDWANINFNVKDIFKASVGKLVIPRASFEFDAYDFDCFFETASMKWLCNQVYQWGVVLDTNPVGGLGITLGATTSPYGEKPFKSNLYTYSAGLSYDFGNFMVKGSYSAWEYEKGQYVPLWSLALKYEDDNWYIFNDLESKAGSYENIYENGLSEQFHLQYSFNDKWSIAGRFNYDRYSDEKLNLFKPSLLGLFQPFEFMRFHALAACTFLEGAYSLNFNIGVTFKLEYCNK